MIAGGQPARSVATLRSVNFLVFVVGAASLGAEIAAARLLQLCRDRLTPGGFVLVNVGHPEGDNRLERAITATMESVFPTVLRDPVESTNSLVLGSAALAGAARLRAAVPSLPADIAGLASRAAQRLAPGLPGGEVFTDDRAPVEWLIDESIVRYAAGHR